MSRAEGGESIAEEVGEEMGERSIACSVDFL